MPGMQVYAVENVVDPGARRLTQQSGAHVKKVPDSDGGLWRVPPFVEVIRGGLIQGRNMALLNRTSHGDDRQRLGQRLGHERCHGRGVSEIPGCLDQPVLPDQQRGRVRLCRILHRFFQGIRRYPGHLGHHQRLRRVRPRNVLQGVIERQPYAGGGIGQSLEPLPVQGLVRFAVGRTGGTREVLRPSRRRPGREKKEVCAEANSDWSHRRIHQRRVYAAADAG